MPGRRTSHGCMTDVLGCVAEVTLFCDKYHLLPPDERVAFDRETARLQQRLSDACVVLPGDVGALSRRIAALQKHFERWMQSDGREHKQWNLHPADDLRLLVSKSRIVLARMEHEILTHQICHK
jgi:hypothetical protein